MEVGLELSNQGKTLLWRAIDRKAFIIGKNPDCDLCVPGDEVMPVQCVLRFRDRRLVLENSSSAALQVAGEAVAPQSEFVLANGDTFAIGHVLATVRFVGTSRHDSPGQTRTLGEQNTPDGGGILVRLPQVFEQQSWAVDAVGVTVGSDPGNTVVLDDPYISAFHAQFSLQDGRCFVRDLGSRNGVFVGGQMVRDGEVSPGTTVRIGQTDIEVSSATAAPEVSQVQGYVSSAKAMQQVIALIDRFAATEASVLIVGETGTGKEVAANRLQRQSARHGKPFRALNCGAFTGSLIQSELFGHAKGAFTGADRRRQGAFESTDGGTLFLDEIGELPVDLQPPLLRVVEAGELFPVGGDKLVTVDVRLIAATNRDLQAEVKAGRFRQDLLHRLNVLSVTLPPLRDLREDIVPLAEYFVSQFAPGDERIVVDESAQTVLLGYNWPGNIRELRNVVQRAVLMRNSNTLTEADMVFQRSNVETRAQVQGAVTGLTLSELEKRAILSALVQASGNKTTAAELLGVARSTVHRKMQQHDIDDDMIAAALSRKTT